MNCRNQSETFSIIHTVLFYCRKANGKTLLCFAQGTEHSINSKHRITLPLSLKQGPTMVISAPNVAEDGSIRFNRRPVFTRSRQLAAVCTAYIHVAPASGAPSVTFA